MTCKCENRELYGPECEDCPCEEECEKEKKKLWYDFLDEISVDGNL